MSIAQRLIVALFNGLTGAIFRIDDSQVARIPERGPLILVTNHVNIMEIPILYGCLQPRRLHGLVLAERWKNRLVGWGLDVCGSIPLERGGTNLDGMRQALDVLRQGEMLIIMPEGTRSRDGQLGAAHPGVVTLALKSGASLLPVAFSGGENYPQNLKKLRRTPFHLAVGQPFRLDGHGQPYTRQSRTKMVAEIMYRLAALLPPQSRGLYADLSQATREYITE